MEKWQQGRRFLIAHFRANDGSRQTGRLVDGIKTKSEINAHIFVFNKALVDDKSAVKFLSVQIQLISRCHANET